MRSLETALQSAEQYQYQHDHQNEAQPAAGAITPAAAIRPCGQGTEQDQHQNHNQNRTKHNFSLSRTMPDENRTGTQKFRYARAAHAGVIVRKSAPSVEPCAVEGCGRDARAPAPLRSRRSEFVARARVSTNEKTAEGLVADETRWRRSAGVSPASPNLSGGPRISGGRCSKCYAAAFTGANRV